MSTLIYVKMGHAKNVAYGKADRLYTVALPQFGVSRKSWYFCLNQHYKSLSPRDIDLLDI